MVDTPLERGYIIMEVFIVIAESIHTHQSFIVDVFNSEELAKEVVERLTKQEPSGKMSKRINSDVYTYYWETFDVKGEKD